MLRRFRQLAVTSLLALGGACGRVAFEPQADAASEDSTPNDARCSGLFAPPTLIAELNSNLTDATLRLTGDELSGVMWSARGGNIDLYRVVRTALDQPFSITPMIVLNSTSNEFDPTISSDGSTIVFASSRPGGAGQLDLYESVLVGTDFTAPVRLASLATAVNDSQPFLQGNELYFVSPRSGFTRIYRAARLGVATYGAATEVTELSLADEFDPVVRADGLQIFWRSSRTNGGDVYTGTRSSTSQPFGDLHVVSELTTSVIDAPSSISSDGCRMIMSSDRGGMPQIYATSRL